MEERQTIKFRKASDKRRLNKRNVETLPTPPSQARRPGQAWYYDSGQTRLAICVSSTGVKTWYWVGRIRHRPTRIKIGVFPEVTPHNAGVICARISADVAAGKDPREERRKAQEWTFDELFAHYIEHHARPHKRTWEDDKTQYERYLSAWKKRRLSSLSRADVRTLHAKIGKNAPYAANRMLALVSKVFAVAIADDDVPYDGDNPAKGIKRYPEEKRDRYLKGDELQRLFAALDEELPLFQDYFILLLLTGVRRSNLAAMRWEHVDLDECQWRIPTTKNNDPLRVHLHTEAVEILRRRRAEVNDNCPWVFPSPSRRGRHLADAKAAWERVRERAGLQDVRMHDLRRTLGSWQAAAGTSLQVIGKSLGHRSLAATSVYARLDLDPVRTSVNTAVEAMLTAAKPK